MSFGLIQRRSIGESVVIEGSRDTANRQIAAGHTRSSAIQRYREINISNRTQVPIRMNHCNGFASVSQQHFCIAKDFL
ncbi:MAG: hypothetical protein A2W18_07215 [Candidatus Muproteobacteria bacterium RBG_16_60_9]|uniref:Uncharacterized protein n=1 Tax=Candidatus Muproteobacteria bacterium RBG_16_60_9 TaxID=1817755 RepID=A0A1F6VI73_9PROT|nr:MAG: hypothetical protein A2W18_07215 [Candidatus Muproteobacteria bacterium RBG_16_60_9]